MSGTQWWHCVHCEMLVPSSAACLPPHPPSPPVRIAATSSEVGDVGGEVPHRTGCPDGSPGLLENQLPPKSFRQKAAPPPTRGVTSPRPAPAQGRDLGSWSPTQLLRRPQLAPSLSAARAQQWSRNRPDVRSHCRFPILREGGDSLRLFSPEHGIPRRCIR